MGNVVSFGEYKINKSYQRYYTTMGNVCLSCENQKRNRRDIRKELIEGYMKLLTNYINNK